MEPLVPGIVLIIVAVAFLAAAAKKVKIPFFTHKTAALGLIITLGLGVYWYNWGDLRTTWEAAAADVTFAPGVEVTVGTKLIADGSESDNALVYDFPSQTFTASIFENTGDHLLYNAPADLTGVDLYFSTLTLSITVYRTDSLIMDDNALFEVTASVPTFTGPDENSGISYQVVDMDGTTKRFEVAFTPAGVTARDAQNWFSLGAGGSRVITVVIDLDNPGIRNMDVGQVSDIVIGITGLERDFIVRVHKAGEA